MSDINDINDKNDLRGDMSDELTEDTVNVCPLCEGLGFVMVGKTTADGKSGKIIEYNIFAFCECEKINKKAAQTTQNTHPFSKKKRDWID